MAKQRYVVRVASNREERVRDNLLVAVRSKALEDKITNVLVPTETMTEIKGGKKRVVHRKIYSGYVMVEMELDDETWFLVKETPGISAWLRIGSGLSICVFVTTGVNRGLRDPARTQTRMQRLPISGN